ncbi:hypothetical protein BC834DRAFT_637248 [Gloeopeniophorella convolvens]|nr:hypothetical protein BC834DRAFT_637248 [Gloeopeniophorella convolvens]
MSHAVTLIEMPVDNTFGMFYLGVALSAMVFGMSWSLAYSYYKRHSTADRFLMKAFIAVLLVLDASGLALMSHVSYVAIVTNFGDYKSDMHTPWTFGVQEIVAVVLSAGTQNFFAYKIYQLGRRTVVMPVLIFIVSFAASTMGILFSAQIFQPDFISAPQPRLEMSVATLVTVLVRDLLVSAGMVYYLLRNRGDIPRTNSALKLLAFYFITCGTLNFVVTMTRLILTVRLPGTWISIPFYLIESKLNFCSFMAIMNSRHHVRAQLHAPDGVMSLPAVAVPKSSVREKPIAGTVYPSGLSVGSSGTGDKTHPDALLFDRVIDIVAFG